MSIYEVHLVFRGGGNPLADNRIAQLPRLRGQCRPNVSDLVFTHVELMPIMAHPFAVSVGYQVNRVLRTDVAVRPPYDFRTFVDLMHDNGIGSARLGAAHFPRDDWALALFYGTHLSSTRTRRPLCASDWAPDFNLSRDEVKNFLLANGLYWLNEHPPLSTDCCRRRRSMLYLDYSRKEGEWLPNDTAAGEPRAVSPQVA